MRPDLSDNPLPGTPALPLLHLLFDHWTAMCGTASLPDPAAFDILDVPRLFGHLHVVEVTDNPIRFRFRLFGTRIVDIGGRDLTGQWVDEIVPPEWSHDVHEAFATALHQRKPCYSSRDLQRDGRSFVLHRLACPMSTDGRTVDRLLVGIEPEPKKR